MNHSLNIKQKTLRLSQDQGLRCIKSRLDFYEVLMKTLIDLDEEAEKAIESKTKKVVSLYSHPTDHAILSNFLYECIESYRKDSDILDLYEAMVEEQ